MLKTDTSTNKLGRSHDLWLGSTILSMRDWNKGTTRLVRKFTIKPSLDVLVLVQNFPLDVTGMLAESWETSPANRRKLLLRADTDYPDCSRKRKSWTWKLKPGVRVLLSLVMRQASSTISDNYISNHQLFQLEWESFVFQWLNVVCMFDMRL